MVIIPKFNENGELPKGEYQLALEEVETIFGKNSEQRKKLMQGLFNATENLARAGVRKIWINGSFVTSKEEPNDIDGCWEYHSEVSLEKLDPVFLMESRLPMKEKYGLEFFPSSVIEGASGLPFPQFFQINRERESKGIVFVYLGGGNL